MNEKPVKVDIDFNEALRRIANTPKGVVEKKLVNTKEVDYNSGEATKKPPPSAKRRG